MLGLGVGVKGFVNVFTQYVVRIETLIRRFCPEGILSEVIMSGRDFVLNSTSLHHNHRLLYDI